MDAFKGKPYNRLSTYYRPQTAQEKRKFSKKRLLTERELPTQLDVLVPESRLYSKLLKLEQRVDATIARKHIELQEALSSTGQQNVILRLMIYNEFHDQKNMEEPESPSTSGDPPGWTLRIQGQILEKESLQPIKNHRYAFSNFLSKMVVQLDPKHYKGADSTLVWRKDTAESICDGFEIRRSGEEECDCKISFWLDHAPPKFQVAKPLDKIIGLEMGSMDTIISALWDYIKENELLDDKSETKTTITLNKDLQKVFGRQTVEMNDLVKEIRTHLRPPDPIVFKYRIRLSGNMSDFSECFDLSVKCPDRFSPKINPNTSAQDRLGRPSTSHYVEINKIQHRIYETINETHHHLRRREFLSAFAESPVDVINLLLTAQYNEVKSAERSHQLPKNMETNSEVFQQDWVPDAVDRYLRTLQPDKVEEYDVPQ